MSAAGSLWLGDGPLVLASKSTMRRAMLEAAGLPVEVQVANVDERGVETTLRARGADAADVAAALAAEKALAVSRLRPEAIVIGADQTLDLEGEALHKPVDMNAARAQIAQLAGRRHRLHAAAAIAQGSVIIAETGSDVFLTMRPLSSDMIRRYCDAAGPTILGSVGGYQLEGVGIHLFEAIEGDHFTVLGLPLLGLLDALRANGLVAV